MTRPALAGWLLVQAGIATACLAWAPIYSSGWFAPAPLVATVVASALVVVARQRSWPTGYAVAAALTLGLVALLVAYRLDLPTAVSDLAGSWKRLATTGLYVPTTAPMLLVPTVTAGVATLTAQHLLLRSRHPVAAIGPVLAAHLTALGYTAGVASPSGPLVAVLAVASLGIVITAPLLAGDAVAAVGPGVLRRRALPLGGMVAAFVVVVAGVQVRAGGGDTPANLRDRLVPPVELIGTDTPLALIKDGLVAVEPAAVLSVEATGLTDGQRIDRLAVAHLDRYDGSIWTSSARYQVAGDRLPPAAEAATVPTGDVGVTVELEAAYPFHNLPLAGDPVALEEGGLGWDPVSGLLVATGPDTPRELTMTVAVPTGDDATPDFAVPPPSAGSLDLPEIHPDIATVLNGFLGRNVDRADPVGEQLASLERALTSSSFLSNADGPAGHSLAVIAGYLDRSEHEGTAGIGSSEQAAATFAVLARMLGIPARVTVGYLLDTPLSAGSAGPVTVAEDRIHAWVEVWSADGWIGYDPAAGQSVTTAEGVRTESLGGLTPAAAAAREDIPVFSEPELIDDPLPPDGDLVPWVPSEAVIASLPVLYLVVLVVARAVRRRRRRTSGDPARRVVGAWHHSREILTGLGLAGAGEVRSARELAALLDTGADGDEVPAALRELADRLDTALYAPDEPDAAVDAVDRAWSAAGVVVRGARRGAGRRARTVAFLDPRDLLRRGHPGRSTATVTRFPTPAPTMSTPA